MTNQALKLAQQIATAAHAGQMRWGGEPFITHPEAVAGLVAYLGTEYQIAGWLHDVLEDTAITLATLRDCEKTGTLPRQSVEAVEYLTHGEGSYLDYILTVSQNRIAKAVKLADLEHNISTCDTKHRNAKTKWELAKYILEHLT